jgi:hypothetical protein
MLSYSVGYSTTKGHDSGWVVMASDLVGVRGLEPRTSSLSGKRSNRLSYTPMGAPGEHLLPQRRLRYSIASRSLLAPHRTYSVSRRVTSMPPTVRAIRL